MAMKRLFLLSLLFQIKRMDREKLTSQLRKMVHGVEKNQLEKKMDILHLLIAKKMYFVASDKGLLSAKEEEWCQSVLLGMTSPVDAPAPQEEKMDLMNYIHQRRSIRLWKEEPLEKSVFEKLVEAGRWAPSSCNRQSWHFLWTEDKKKIGLLAQIRKQKFIERAPACLILIIDMEAYHKEEALYTPFLDAGAAIENILLMAETIGLGACWINFAGDLIPKREREQINELLSLPESFQIVSFIAIGSPARRPHPPGKKEKEGMMHIESFCKR